MMEYKVIDIRTNYNLLQDQLNTLAQEGWRVVCDSVAGLILERVAPLPEVIHASYSLEQLAKL